MTPCRSGANWAGDSARLRTAGSADRDIADEVESYLEEAAAALVARRTFARRGAPCRAGKLRQRDRRPRAGALLRVGERHRGAALRSALCRPPAARQSGFHSGKRAYTGAGHRRQHRDLQRDRRRAAETPAVSAFRAAGGAPAHGAGHQYRGSQHRCLAVLHLPRRKPGVSGHRHVVGRYGERNRPRRAGGSPVPGGDRSLSPAPGRRARVGTRLRRLRRRPGERAHGDAFGRLLEVALRRGPLRDRTAHDAGWQCVRSDRRAAAVVPVPEYRRFRCCCRCGSIARRFACSASAVRASPGSNRA